MPGQGYFTMVPLGRSGLPGPNRRVGHPSGNSPPTSPGCSWRWSPASCCRRGQWASRRC